MINVWTIDLCRTWVAPPSTLFGCAPVRTQGPSHKSYGKPKRDCIKWIHMHTCISLIMILLYFDEMLHLICCMILWIFMFVLAELWLITYVRDVGTKGKQVPDVWWDVGVFAGAGFGRCGYGEPPPHYFIFRFMILDYVILDFRTNGFGDLCFV